MARILIVGGFIALLFWIYSVVDCALQPSARHRGVRKPAWIAIVILIPVIGGVLWFFLGRRRNDDPEYVRALAPDDDPAFLSSISRAEQDARIRELREELDRLDGEQDGPGAGPRR